MYIPITNNKSEADSKCSQVNMTDRKRLEWVEIEDADYDFDFFDEKEVISEMLNNQAPKSVENFDSTGTQWDLWGDIDDYFIF